jgi:hypothetical protein
MALTTHRSELGYAPPLRVVSLVVLFVGVAAAMEFAAMVAGPDRDQAVYILVGEGMLRGQLPYVDLWDHKPPGVYALAAIASLAPGDTWPALWFLSVAATAGAGVVVARIKDVQTGLLLVIASAVVVSPGMPEAFALLPAVGALAAVLADRPLLGGVLAGVTLTISPQYLALPVALVVLKRDQWRPMLLGGSSVIAGALLALVASGTVRAAADALIHYNRAYLALDGAADFARAIRGWLIVLVPLATVAIIRIRPNRPNAALAVWAVLALGIAVGQGRMFTHYAGPIVPPLVLMSAGALSLGAGASMLALVALTPSGPAWPGVQGAQVTGEWVASNSAETDTLLVWGHEPMIYVHAGRVPAGRYLYLLPLTTPDYSSEATVAEWVDVLEAAPPDILVDAEAANPHWPEGKDFLRPPPPGAAGGRDLDFLEPFRTFVRHHYELVHEVEGRAIYRLR